MLWLPVGRVGGDERRRRSRTRAQLDAPAVAAVKVAAAVATVEAVAPGLVPVLGGDPQHGRVGVLVLVPAQRHHLAPHHTHHTTTATTHAHAAAGAVVVVAGVCHEEGGVVDGHAAQRAQPTHAQAHAVRVPVTYTHHEMTWSHGRVEKSRVGFNKEEWMRGREIGAG